MKDLDSAIPPKTSFLVGIDIMDGRREGRIKNSDIAKYQEGNPIGYCVKNGILASSQSHLVLALAIARIVGYTFRKSEVWDVFREMCPSRKVWELLKARKLLVTGPCLLGTTLNMVG